MKRDCSPSPDAPEEVDAKKRRKSARSAAPTAAPICKTEEVDIKPTKEQLLPRDKPAEHWWPRPQLMENQGANLYRIEDISEAPFVVPPGSELDARLQRMLALASGGFKRTDMMGPQQQTYWNLKANGTRPEAFGVSRMAIIKEGNLACREARKAVLDFTDIWKPTAEGERCALWVRDVDRNAEEPWFPFGIYRALWNGPARVGEYDALTQTAEDKDRNVHPQDVVADAHGQYVDSWSKYSEYIFSDLAVQLDPKDPRHQQIGVDKDDLENEVLDNAVKATRRIQVRRAARAALSKGYGLKIGYTIMVYDGPISDAELKAAVQERAKRQADPVACAAERRAKSQAKKAAAKAKGKGKKAKGKATASAKKPASAKTAGQRRKRAHQEEAAVGGSPSGSSFTTRLPTRRSVRTSLNKVSYVEDIGGSDEDSDEFLRSSEGSDEDEDDSHSE